MQPSTAGECRVFTPMPGHTAQVIVDHGDDRDVEWALSHIKKGVSICHWPQ